MQSPQRPLVKPCMKFSLTRLSNCLLLAALRRHTTAIPFPFVADCRQAVQLEQPLVVVEPGRWMVPPSLRPFLVLLPQHDAECPDCVVSNTQEMFPRVPSLEVIAPTTKDRVNPFLDEPRQIKML